MSRRSLSLLHRSPRGDQMMLNSQQLDIATRIQKGDPTAGWEGDPRMFVSILFDLKSGVGKRIEVWRRGEDSKDRIIMSFSPEEFDHRVLVKLVQGDTRKRDVLAEIDAHNASIERDVERNLQDLQEEVSGFIKFARKKLYNED